MKAADAKNPQFDAQWWKRNKALAADVLGKFEKLLKQYEVVRANATTAAKKITASNLDAAAVKVLQALKAEALSKDLKLGPAQKETKEARENYAKRCDFALKQIATLQQTAAGLPGVPQLLGDKLFLDYCKAAHVEENTEFLLALKANQPPQKIYDKIIGADRLNIDDLKRDFDVIARAIKNGSEPDADKAWAKAPWAETKRVVEALLNNDIVPRYRRWRVTYGLPKVLPD